MQMIALHKDPQGVNVFKRIEVTTVMHAKQGNTSSGATETITSTNKDYELNSLRERIMELEEKLHMHLFEKAETTTLSWGYFSACACT